MFLWKPNRKTILAIAILILLSIPSVISLLRQGFFQSDDGEWMIIRFSAFHQALRDGQIPARFLSRLNNGYGYPVANFLYPGFMYLAEPVKLFGFGFVNTVKIILGFSMIGSALFAYFWLNKIFDKTSALTGALFYLYVPYHLFDIYNRGSVGEVLALVVVPFILYQIERKSFFWITAGISFLILSHNTLAVLFLPIIILYMILKRNKETSIVKQLNQYISILLPAFGLSAFFWIPAVFELHYTHFSSTIISDFSNYFAKIDLIGYSSILVIYLSLFLFVYYFKIKKKSNISTSLFLFFLFLGFLGIVLSSRVSLVLWRFLPSSFIQFPFRMLSYLVLSASFLSSYIIYFSKGIRRYCLLAFLIGLLFYSSFSYLFPKEFFNKGDNFYSTNEGTTTVHDEYMPNWIKDIPKEHFKNKLEILKGNGKIKDALFNNKTISFKYASIENSIIRINTIYYPGWNAYVDGKQVIIDYSNDKGVMDIVLTRGEKNIKLSFSETPLGLFADFISVVSFISLIILSKFHKTNKKF